MSAIISSFVQKIEQLAIGESVVISREFSRHGGGNTDVTVTREEDRQIGCPPGLDIGHQWRPYYVVRAVGANGEAVVGQHLPGDAARRAVNARLTGTIT